MVGYLDGSKTYKMTMPLEVRVVADENVQNSQKPSTIKT